MADLQRIIEIVFQGTDQVAGSVLAVSKGMDTVADKAKAITGPLAGVADSIAKADLAIAGLGIAFLGFAFNEAVEFESAILDLQKVLTDSEGDVDQYIPKIEELADTYGVAATDVLTAAANFKQSGFTIEESLNLTDLALKAVKISELDVNESSQLLISTLRGFGAEAVDSSRLLDILNAVSNNYAATVGELGRGMADLSPIAKTAGLSFEETAGILTPVIEIFGSGSEAAVALKTALLRLGSDTKSVQDALAALGVSQVGANGALRASGDILKELAAIWPTLAESQQSYYAAELVGIDQAPRLQAVLGNYETVLGATKVAFEAAGSAQKEWEVRMNSAVEVINRAVGSFDSLLRTIGNQYRAEMAGAVGATGDLAGEFSKLIQSGGLEPLFAQLRPLLTGIAADLRAVGAALPGAFDNVDIAPLVKGFEALGTAVSELFQGADLTTAEGLQSVLQDLTNIGGGFLQVTAGLVKGITPAVRAIADMGQEFGEMSPEAQKASGAFLGVTKVLDVLLGLVGPASSGLESIGLGMQAIAGASIVKTLSGTAAGFTALAAPIAAAAAALGGLVFAYSEVTTAFEDYNARTQAQSNAAANLEQTQQRLVDKLKLISTELGITIPDMAAFNKLVSDGEIVFNQASGTWQKATEAVTSHGEAQALTADEINAAIKLEKEFQEAIAQEAENIEASTAALQERNDSLQEEAEYTVEVVDGVKTYTQTLASKTAAQSADVKSTQEATEASEEYRLALEKIASDERLKNIEARVTLETAELEAATAVTIASFESIDNTITSTGELLGKLFDNLTEADNIRDKWTIEDQIEKENALREEAAGLQSGLVQEQIAYLREKTAALAKGDALIKITGDGLQPELEAFMWRIIERVQIRASDEGAEFLLGIT